MTLPNQSFLEIEQIIIENLEKNFFIFLNEIISDPSFIETLFLQKNQSVTKVNHLIPASYFSYWTKEIPQNKGKKARENSFYFKENNTESLRTLQNFASKKNLFVQTLENLFTNFTINNKKYDTEKIEFLSRLQSYIDFDFIDLFFIYSKNSEKGQKGIKFSKSHLSLSDKEKELKRKKNQLLTPQLESKILNDFSTKYGHDINEIRLFFNYFKARQTLYKLCDEQLYQTTNNVINFLLIHKDHTSFNYAIQIFIIEIVLFYCSFKHLSLGENNHKYHYLLVFNHFSKNKNIDLKNNFILIEKFLNYFKLQLNNYKTQDNSFCSYLNSIFLQGLFHYYSNYYKNSSFFIFRTKLPLPTIEHPLVFNFFDEKETSICIQNYVKEGYIDTKYLQNNESSFLYYFVYSPHILIIEANEWYLDFLHKLVLHSQEDLIIDEYQKAVKNTSNDLHIFSKP